MCVCERGRERGREERGGRREIKGEEERKKEVFMSLADGNDGLCGVMIEPLI